MWIVYPSVRSSNLLRPANFYYEDLIMNTAILVIFFHVGAMGSGNSNATTAIPMKDVTVCQREAPKIIKLVQGTVKAADFVCLNNQ